MKQITLLISAIFFIAFNCAAQQGGPIDQDAMMKAWQNYMTPGDVHKMLAKSDGEWTGDVTMWIAPGAPPQKSPATIVNKMILGGRYQESTWKVNMMNMPFEGTATTGYDNAKKMFVSTWVDNMGTGIMYMDGTWDDATKTVTLKGKQTDPMTGNSTDIKETLKIVDDNNQLMEMFSVVDGKEVKTMEVKLKKK